MSDSPQVIAAREEVDRSRARLMATAHELQERLKPRTLARDAWEGAKDKGAGLAEEAVDAVRARPFTTTGVVAAITLFLAREPLFDLARGLFDEDGEKKRRKESKRKAKKMKQKDTETAE